ncbi:hypothetical protein EUX98_g5449 [Antrodiella citrinella]|uniref:AAA+ ATPase domain-containing protein n=1 Tax=Antrodiella citrinella TaxID=2447956 RepID=A0A4S4MTU1_9APHY|nr:hypothetical protein EUX98_g5449 [Antrodiella citrinella]
MAMPAPAGESIDYDPGEAKGDKDAQEEEELATGSPGSVLEVKHLDEVYDMFTGQWSVKPTPAAAVAQSNKDGGKYDAYIFTVIRRFNPSTMSSDRKATSYTMTKVLEIHSEALKKVGKEILGNVQGISWTAKPLRVNPQILLGWLPELQEYGKKLALTLDGLPEDHTDRTTMTHVHYLLSYLITTYATTLDTLSSLVAHGEIIFDLLWALFVPSKTILYLHCPVTNEPRAVRLIHAEKCQKHDAGPGAVSAAYDPSGLTISGVDGNEYSKLLWRLVVEYVEVDIGTRKDPVSGGPVGFGYAGLGTVLDIPGFVGATKISELGVFPIQYYSGPDGPDGLRKRLISRGRKWAQMGGGVHHLSYSGIAYQFRKHPPGYAKCNVNSRVMIDRRTFADTVPNYDKFPIVHKTLSGVEIDRHALRNMNIATFKPDPEASLPELSDDQLMLTTPILYGFSLSDKQWLEFVVDFVEPFEWNNEAYANLVIPPEQKTILTTLVEAHNSGPSAKFDDFVEGKGLGLVINLFGNPGTGKSLTAEAMSEYLRKPLYIVGAGDLGTSAERVDTSLSTILKISATWSAVVLIDEADVFLEERSLMHLERNAMVAVFLRHLEYFRGILFLTTNRVRVFDEAFQSRIHVSLRYHDLSPDARRKIWVAFLKKVHGDISDGGLSADELRDLGEKKINGRQIKNVVRTAGALASGTQEKLGYRHLVGASAVPTDQWLVTHIDTSWKIQQVKLFLLAKFFPSSFISVPYLPRPQASSKRRAVSPIRFAAKPAKPFQSSPAAAQVSDGEDEDEDDFGDEFLAQYKWSANPRRSTSIIPMLVKPEQTSEDKASDVDPAHYTLLAFSSGQILEDQFNFEWFNLNSHELLELHSSGFLVSLPKSVPDVYILPYFEARVWALRAITRDKDDIDGGKGDSMENTPYVASDDRSGDPHAVRREKLAKKPRTKLEWRVRWVIIHQGLFKLFKSRKDIEPVHVSSLSSLIAIRGAEHLSSGMTSSISVASSNADQSKDKDKDRMDAKNVVSAKFRAEKSSQTQPRNSVVDVSASVSGNWWRRGSRDDMNPQERRKGSAPDSERDGSGDGEQGQQKEAAPDGSVLIVLDMLEADAFQHILRLFHLHAPPTVYSSFFPAFTSMDAQKPNPTHRHFSLEANVRRPPSPISFAARPSSAFPPSSPSSSQSLVSSYENSSSSLPSRTWTPPLLIPTTNPGVGYPEWRRRIFDKARRAGMGFTDTAISHHVFGESPDQESAVASSTQQEEGPQSPTDVGSAESDLLFQPGEVSDSSSSIAGNGTDSETEWEGWPNDVQRRREEAFTQLTEDREKNAIRWDSSWTWGSQDEGPLHEESSLSPGSEQTSFMIASKTTEGSHSMGRSVTSYASAESLYKRTIKRNNSKRDLGTAAVAGTTVRVDIGDDATTLDESKARPRSPLSAEFDDEDADAVGHEPRYSYTSPQASSSRHQHARAAESDAPFYSYYDSSQRLPRSMEMSTISSVVSVGGRGDAQGKKKKKEKEAQKSRGTRKSVLTAYSSLAHTASFGRHDHGSSKSHVQSNYRPNPDDVPLEHPDEEALHSSIHRAVSLPRATKPKLAMEFMQGSSGSGLTDARDKPASAVSATSADWESPRFAAADEIQESD